MNQLATVNISPIPQSSQDLMESRYVIELAGPAGSGKTTLRKLLCENDAIAHGDIPASSKLLRQLPKTLPAVLTSLLPGSDRRFTWSEIRSMLYLQAWLADRRARPDLGVTLYDQGPVFRLAILQEFGPKAVSTSACKNWLRGVLKAWSRTLNLVVWLDAPNETLLARIRGRENQQHACQTLADCDANVLLDRYRTAHERVLAEMQQVGGTRVLRIVSADHTPREIASTVVDELRRLNHE